MDYTQLIEKIKNLDTSIKAALIAAVVAFAVGVFNLVIGLLNYANQRKALKIQQATFNLQTNTQKDLLVNLEISRLEKELDEFYKPFNSYLSQSYLLYSNLRIGLPTGFRTLIYLVDNDYLFEDHDKVAKKVIFDRLHFELLNEIFSIEDKLRDLIIAKGGLINDTSLLMAYSPDGSLTDVLLSFDPNKPDDLPQEIGLLDLFIIHCILIKFAKNGLLDKASTETYKKFVYPRELNKKIKQNMTDLTNKIKSLKQQLV